MAENLNRMQCPIWERSSEPGKGFRGSIAFDSLKRILQVYDDDKWPSSPFPELALQLANADIKLKPITSRNNNHKMGKMTVTYPTAAMFPSVIHADEVFTFTISLEDSNTIISTKNSWTKSKAK
jgi:hypothetical protein